MSLNSSPDYSGYASYSWDDSLSTIDDEGPCPELTDQSESDDVDEDDPLLEDVSQSITSSDSSSATSMMAYFDDEVDTRVCVGEYSHERDGERLTARYGIDHRLN
ncbi:hypothetical protein H4R33_002966 [Dimargaris cristalligena]|nr:hypothetical protein H4R33_002966 [Dimargaris cristalligena]